MGISVVHACDLSKPLLPCCVPYLYFDRFAAKHNILKLVIDPSSANEALFEFALGVSDHEGALTDASISYEK